MIYIKKREETVLLTLERDRYYSESGARITARVLKTAGIFPDKNGYEYLVHLVDLLIRLGKTDLSRLYLAVGNLYHTSAKSIEAAVTYLVHAMSREGLDIILRTLGLNQLAELQCRLTAKETIYLLYDYVRGELKARADMLVTTKTHTEMLVTR